MITQTLDGVTFRMGAVHDFSFLARFGTVFCVFDDQDSGNICFGMIKGDVRTFVKYAGAVTARGTDHPAQAVSRLRASLPIYRDLAHEHLIRLLAAGEMGGGYAMVFDWADAVCMGKMYPQQREAFLQLDTKGRMRVFEDILDFLIHVHERGYVAIDLYDGSVMYDFFRSKTVLCDIDLFAKKPCVNTMGRMWGSSRFMSPEEFELGAPIDEVTNVYLAGAMAFALLGVDTDRRLQVWSAGEALYQVAHKAVQSDRAQRYPTLWAMKAEWMRAKASLC